MRGQQGALSAKGGSATLHQMMQCVGSVSEYERALATGLCHPAEADQVNRFPRPEPSPAPRCAVQPNLPRECTLNPHPPEGVRVAAEVFLHIQRPAIPAPPHGEAVCRESFAKQSQVLY